MSVLRGPADADMFRVQVGRYGDRFYCDPLPLDHLATATDEHWPSQSTIKKGAAGQDWSFVAMRRVASLNAAEFERMAKLDPEQRYDTLKSANSYGLSVAAGRGTIVHAWAEDLLWGREPRKLLTDRIPDDAKLLAESYRAALLDWFGAYQPELIAAEYVGINRRLNNTGYGCTPDALVRVEGEVYAVDWKTRDAQSAHAAYPEEGAQIAAGANVDYIVVEHEGQAIRRLLPEIEGGLVVSIRPDGARTYSIDLGAAWRHWQALHAWWCARQDEREVIGQPWHVKRAPTDSHLSATPAEKQWASPTDPDVIARGKLRDRREPAEGDDIADAAVYEALKARYFTLGPAPRSWLNDLVNTAKRNAVPFAPRERRSVRRIELFRALIHLAETDPDDDTVRQLVALILKEDWPLHEAVPAGAVVGALDWAEATALANAVGGITEGRTQISVSPEDGAMTLAAVAS